MRVGSAPAREDSAYGVSAHEGDGNCSERALPNLLDDPLVDAPKLVGRLGNGPNRRNVEIARIAIHMLGTSGRVVGHVAILLAGGARPPEALAARKEHSAK
jgi:hypothetical protein